VLVWHDALGFTDDARKLPKFVRQYAALEEEATRALTAFVADVRGGRFPSSAETYHMTDRMAVALDLEGALELDEPDTEPAQ
jgi:3-methyl-2-oxobutanoate hydroxymethyltransferase